MSRKISLYTALVILVTIAMITAPVAMATGGAGVGAGDAVEGDDAIASALDSFDAIDEDVAANDTAASGDDASGDVTIDEAVEDGDGTTEAIVRFDALDPSVVATSADPRATLEGHADTVQADVVDFAARTEGIEVVNQFWIANAALVTIDTDRVDLEALAARDGVTEIHENFAVETPEPASFETADGDEANVTYGLEQINTTAVWEEFDTKGEGAKIAVLDTGVDVDHPDLDLYTENPNDETYPGGWAEIDGTGAKVPGSTPHDTGFHGTHVSGTVAGGNASGTAIGVAPESNLMHGLVLPGGSGSFAQIVGGMEWAVDEDADVVSMSLGADGYHPALIEPVINAEEAGSLVVGSAGNSGLGVTGSPGNVYESFAIGASDENEEIALFSGGETIDTDEAWGTDAPAHWPDEYVVPNVAAPGVGVLSAVPEDYFDDPEAIYGYADGTSMAAPHVSGAAALMISASGGQLTPAEMKDAFEVHAWKPDGEDDGQDDRYGHGIIDALAATATSAVDSGISGTVEDVDGEPIAGATVSFEGFPVLTDEDGAYEVNLAPGEYAVEADAFAHQPSTEVVTVEEDEFTEQDFTLEPSVEAVLLDGGPLGIEDGESFDVEVYVENLEEYEVSAIGDYPDEELTLSFDGEPIELDEPKPFDEPVDGNVTITVESAEETSGDIVLEHSFSGFGVTDEFETGPTGVYDETVDVGVVDDPSSSLGNSLQTHLQVMAPWFDVDVVDADELEGAVEAGDYDVYLVQHFGDADVEWFLEETETPETGVVLLDQFAGESDGISQYVEERGNPNAVVNATGSIQQPTVAYEVHDDHPFFEGVGEPGDVVELYTSPAVFVQAGYHAAMEGFSSGDYGNVVTADTAITGAFGTTATGAGLAEDQFTNTVWAPSLGQGSYAAIGDSFESDAYAILANVVEQANDEPVIEPTSPQDDRIDPGDETTVTAETPDLESVTVSLAEESTLTEENLSLTINGEPVAFDETVELDDESLTITAESEEDVTGLFSLEHSVVTTPENESVETVFATGPTSVYTPPLEVPGDVDSIQHALDLAIDGERIVVDDGEYEEEAEDAPISWGPALWIENDGITLEAAEDAEPTILYAGDDWVVQNGIYVTGDDVTLDGLTINKVDGEADENAMNAIVTDVYEGTPTTNLTAVDITHAGHRGVMIDDGVSDVTLDGWTVVDGSGLAGSYTVYVMDEADETAGDGTDAIEDSTVFDPELHGLEEFADVDFAELEAYGLDFNDVDLDQLDLEELEPDDLTLEALVDHDLEWVEGYEPDVGADDGMSADDTAPAILPTPDPVLVTENIHIVDSVMEQPDDDGAHGLVLRDVQNVTVEDSEIAHEDLRRAIFFQSAQQQETTDVEPVAEDITIRNVVAEARTTSDSVIRFRSASGTIEDTTIEDGTIGVRQDEHGQVPLDLIEPEIEIVNSSIDVEAEGVFAKHATTLTTELTEIDAETGVHLEGEIDPDDVTIWFNDLSATEIAVALDGETVGVEPVDARLNYLGEDAPPAVGDVELSPFLPEPPGDEIPDIGEIDAPVVGLQLEADGVYAIGVPGPSEMTIAEVFPENPEGIVYGFDAESQSWNQLTGDDSLDALQALLVMPEADTQAHLSFAVEDGPPGPGQTDLVEGWNFVAAPFAGDVADVFDYATSDVTLVMHTYDRPTGQLGVAGDLDGTWTGGDADVSPFEGYFAFSDGDGTLPAHLSADPDLFQLYEQLGIGEQAAEPAEIELSGLEPAEATVEQGEELDVIAMATNTAETATTQTLELRADEAVLAVKPIGLEGEESTFVTFENVPTDDLDPDEYVHGIYGADDNVTGSLTVEAAPDPASFAVDDLDPDHQTVEQGEPIDVSATVTNDGDVSDEQTVVLQIGGTTLEGETVALDGGESTTVAFEDVPTAGFEPGSYVLAVASDDDQATGVLTVLDDEPDGAEFEVDDLDPDAVTVEQGEAFDVSATVSNVGDEAGEETVDLAIDGDVVANETVDLVPGESTTVDFEDVATADLAPDEYSFGVYSDDDEATGTLTVEAPPEPATFEVSDLDPEEITVQTGEEITVSATVTNVGDEAGEETVDFAIDGDVFATESVDLEADETETVTFENVSTSDLDPDEYPYSVSTADDEATGTLTVLTDEDVVLHTDPDPKGYESTHTWEVTNLDLDGEEIDQWIVDYEDTGVNLSQSATLDMDLIVTTDDGDESNVNVVSGDGEDTDEIRHFSPGAFQTVVPGGPTTFEMPDVINPEEPGEYNATITFEGDGDAVESFETTFEITEIDPAEFDVAAFDAPATVAEDEPFDVESTIENVGDVEETQTVEYRIVEAGGDIGGADPLFEQNVTLDLGEMAAVDFTDIVPGEEDLEPGSYEHGIFTDDDNVTADLEIAPFDAFSVSSLDFEAPAETVANQPFDVTTTVTNYDDETRTETVELRFGEPGDLETIDETELTLDAEASTEVVFADVVVDDDGYGEGEYVHGIFADESDHTAEIDVYPAVDVDLTVDPDETGETATHTWEIESADFDGANLDYIDVEYAGTDTDFSDVEVGDVTLELTNDGDDEPSEVGLSEANSEFEYEYAHLTFGLFDDSSSDGEANVVFENVENPGESGEYTATLVFVEDPGLGDEYMVLTYTATFEVE